MPNLQLTARLSIFYEEYQTSGTPPVLLLHGLGANNKSWGMQLPALQAAGFRIITPDIRGFGKSTYPGGGVSFSHVDSDMVGLLHYLQIDSAVIAGVSMGGVLALQPDSIARRQQIASSPPHPLEFCPIFCYSRVVDWNCHNKRCSYQSMMAMRISSASLYQPIQEVSDVS